MKIRQKIIPLIVSLLLGMGLLVHNHLAEASLVCNSQGIMITGADANWCNSTNTPPNTLNNLLNLVAPRVAADYARSIASLALESVPNSLDTALQQVAHRVGFDYARANRHEVLTFPTDLINDVTNPLLIGDITETPISETESRIQWVTNEFADSEVIYGSISGNYPNAASSALFVKNHSLIIGGLQTGATYYYRVISTDLSGNTFQSGELSFTFRAQTDTYLPMVVR